MADVISSRKKQQRKLAEDLNYVVKYINKEYSELILSPLTITLGDEFQGVCKSSDSAVDLLLSIEEFLLILGVPFSLRYVVLEGNIDTKINTDTSYGMLGSGLTDARNSLNSMSKSSSKFNFFLDDSNKSNLLKYLFEIISSINNSKEAKKYPEILKLLIYEQMTDAEISKISQKTRSEIWKFRNNWNAENYISAINILRERLYK